MPKKNPYRWVVLIFLFTAFTLQFSTYLSWNPFIPLSKDLFGFTASQSAFIVASVAFGRMLFQIPGGIVVDMFSAKKLLITSLLILSVSTTIVGLADSYWVILFGQFLIGLSGVVVMPLCIKVVLDWFPAQECDLVSGVLNSAASVAVILTNVLIPFVVLNFTWNMSFYILGAGCFSVAILILCCLKLHKQEPTAKKKHKFKLATFTDLLKDRRFRVAMMAHAGAIYTTWGINSWLAMYLKNIGLDTQIVSQMMFLFGLYGCISMASAGVFTRGNFQRRCRFLFCIFFITLLMLIILPFINSEFILWIYVGFLGIIAFAHFGPLNVFVANLVDTKVFATAIAISIFVWQIASITQSLLIGKILDNMTDDISYHLAFLIIALGSISSCMALLKVLFRKKVIYKSHHSHRRNAVKS